MGHIEKLVNSLRSIEVREAELRETIRIEANYFERNAERMRYPQVPATTPLRGARASLKQVAKPSSVPGPSSRVCFGQYAVLTPSLPCVAASSMDASKTTGRHDGPDFQLLCRAPPARDASCSFGFKQPERDSSWLVLRRPLRQGTQTKFVWMVGQSEIGQEPFLVSLDFAAGRGTLLVRCAIEKRRHSSAE